LALHRSSDLERRTARVQRVLAALEDAPRQRLVFSLLRHRALRWVAAAAALVAVVVVLRVTGVPTESSALAEVQRTIRAMKEGGDRRYEVTLVRSDGPHRNATIDTR